MNEAGWYELTSFDLSNHFDPGIVLMQKFDSEKVYGLIHYDTKAKNYYVKRFNFEMQPAGKEVSIISEEPGSKMIFITGKPDAQVQIDVEKGKSKTPETIKIDLASLIDVKGLKANGNRLSQHEVKKVSLVDAESEMGIELVEPIVLNEVGSLETDVASFVIDIEEVSTETPTEEISVQKAEPASTESHKKEVLKLAKKVDFEITNPDDIKIDDKGQSLLF